MSAVVSVEGLSKAYRLGIRHEVPDTLPGAIRNAIGMPLRRLSHLRRLSTATSRCSRMQSEDLIWALDDVSFKVSEGDVVGVIGRNGAGKSTLLKVLSRITEPTKGRAVIRGRVSSLLEVGTGFHPELTGRDNVYMNGTILGMSKREIDRKFDEIVDFSGVEKFLDTPAKRYSSGMQVRLAFAVAAHLEPEILIVDEVLAVGDADFQKKCMGKMRQVASGGRTVVFVSHNLRSVKSLCNKGVVIRSGAVQYSGSVDQAIASYVSSIQKRSELDVVERIDRGGTGRAMLTSVDVVSLGRGAIATGAPIQFEFTYRSSVPRVECTFTIYDDRGESLLSLNSSPVAPEDRIESPSGNHFACLMEECPLVPGEYRINVCLHSGDERLDHLEGAATFTVESGYMRSRIVRGNDSYGRLAVPHTWSRADA